MFLPDVTTGSVEHCRPSAALSEADLTLLNNTNVNALRVMTGTGVSIMGGRTLKKSGADMYINVRRTIMEITRNLVAVTEVVDLREQRRAAVGAARGRLRRRT